MKVMVADKIAGEGVSKLKTAGLEVLAVWDEPKDKLPLLIKDCDALIVRSATKATKELIDAAPHLKVIGRAGVGLDNVDSAHAKSKNIKVVNTPGATSISVAELAVSLMFAVCRKVAFGDRGTRKGDWPKKSCEGIEIHGKTVGIIGIGKIGKETAKRVMALGATAYYYDIVRPSASDEKQLGIEYRPLDELVAMSDIISIHVPMTPETKGLLNKDRIAKMKKGAILVNTSRGGIVDEAALYDALKSGHLYGAGLDVFETEPLKTSKLFELDNIVMTPHVGAQTEEGQLRAGVQIAELVIKELNALKK
jgi:D-3-phosphoglycerate dehydrogenase